jgi:hypothetical protein
VGAVRAAWRAPAGGHGKVFSKFECNNDEKKGLENEENFCFFL